jgi:hypothetical protein
MVVLMGPPYAAPDECASEVEDLLRLWPHRRRRRGWFDGVSANKTESEPSLRLLALAYGGPLSFYFSILSKSSMNGCKALGIAIEPSAC